MAMTDKTVEVAGMVEELTPEERRIFINEIESEDME